MNHNMQTWHFAVNNDQCVQLVLSGKKHFAAFLYGQKSIPAIGSKSILIFDNEKKACITQTKEIIITEFKNIPERLFSIKEDLPEWKKIYAAYFKTINPDFNEETKIVFEIFEVTKNLVEERFKIAKKIVQAHDDLIGNIKSIKEINAGFNNSIFSVNEKFIIKICTDTANESQFDTEANFYRFNQENEAVAKLYKYDPSKSIVPYVYEIIEQINGKSVYDAWYKMTETQREKLIQELVKILKGIHSIRYPAYDWCAHIKSRVLSSYHQTIDMFNERERKTILKSLEKYDKILSDNSFCLIHNDLHFDNILLDDQHKIKLIDFNDATAAPFDFDLRLLYMSVSLPWKWANIEMDSFQKAKDYQNLFTYIKKYYTELNDIQYLDKRMTIYWILNDFELLPRFRSLEEKERILKNCQKILDC